MLEKSKFTKIDEEFICEYCGKKVPKLGYTCRNHCPYCLHSKHLDINPGDRAEECHGILEPIGLETNSKKGYIIVFKCKIISCSSVNSASGMTSVIGFKEDISEIVFKRQLQRSALYCSPSACCSVVDKSDGAFVIQEFRLSFGTIGPGSSYRNGSTTSIDVVIEKFYGFVILKR